jgi:hypothetical protein
MSESEHSRANDLFVDYQEGTISDTDKTFVEGHLAVCTDCKDEWQKYQQVMSALSGFKQKTPPPDTPDILQGTASKINKRTKGLFFQKKKFGISYELITVLVLLLFAVAYLALHILQGTDASQMQPMQPAQETTPKSKQSALPVNPIPSIAASNLAEPKIKGVTIEKYAFALKAPNTEQNQRHLSRIVLTASGTLSDWKDSPEGVTASFQVPYERFTSFYKDLGASFQWSETKTTEVVASLNPGITGTLSLQKSTD